MPNVRAIGCLGGEAWYLVCKSALEDHAAGRADYFRDSERPLDAQISGKRLLVTAHFHPAARVSLERIRTGWELLRGIISR
jgi:hypothetical protein